ncbi:MAG: alpha/beta hydrolase [Verrucomicrobia bacterium]|nr:alpha/beta hydrolase [Verrucomicrobiota bacterium]
MGFLSLLTAAVLQMRGADSGPDRREPYLRSMATVMGPMPGDQKRCALDLQVHGESEAGGVVRRQISYQSEPGGRVPAWLLLPAGAGGGDGRRHFPGVLALHQTHAGGRNVVVGLGNSPDDEYGLELARRGYVVLAPPYPHLAGYAPDLERLGYVSGTMKAVWDNRRGLDVLESLPFVRTNGFGCIGHSLGGHNGLFTAAWDPRIRVVVSSCGLDSFRDYYDGNPAVWMPGKGWCQERYMPRLAQYRGRLDEIPFDFPQVLAAIAPRRVRLFAPLGDGNFRWQSVERVAADARALVTRAGGVPDLEVAHPATGHRFAPEAREQAYRAMDEVLKAP